MKETAIQTALRQNMYFQMTFLPSHLEDVQIREEEDVTIINSPQRADECFNFVLSARLELSNVKRRVQEVMTSFSCNLEHFSWWVLRTDTPSSLPSELEEHQLFLKATYVDLFLNTKERPKEKSSRLRFQTIETPQELEAFATILEQVDWLQEAAAYRQLPPSIYQHNPSFKMVIGYEDHLPVVVGTLVSHAGVAGLYFVATAPDKRSQGYASSMIIHLMQEAEKMGLPVIVLQATEENALFYRRFGFQPCGHHWEYGW